MDVFNPKSKPRLRAFPRTGRTRPPPIPGLGSPFTRRGGLWAARAGGEAAPGGPYRKARHHNFGCTAWRHPDVPADGTLRFDHYARSAQAAERGKCDLVFFADGIGIRERDVPRGSLARSGYEIVEMEPMTLLPALAVVTKHIGLVVLLFGGEDYGAFVPPQPGAAA